MWEGSSIHPDGDRYEKAWNLYFSSNLGSEAEALALELSREGYKPADFLLGLIYEFGGAGIRVDLDRAVCYYRRSVIGLRDATSLRYLARVLMKQGAAHYDAAFRHLEEAYLTEPSPELHIGLGWYYETSPVPNFALSRKHYLRAAVQGRFHGFFGYSRVSRAAGHRIRALLVDCIRLALGLPYFLIFGKRAQNGF